MTNRPTKSSLSRRAVVGGGLSVAAASTLHAHAATPAASPSASPAASPVATEGGGLVQQSAIDGVPDVILKAPTPYRSYDGTPWDGGTVVYKALSWDPPVTPRDKNTYWQELEKKLGVEKFDMTQIPVETYEEKVAALIASNDLGDLFYIHNGIGPAAVLNQAIDQGAFVDLTDHLTGDNLKKYPNLARFPERMWKESAINGRIYGVPQPMYAGPALAMYRKDWADKLGLSDPKNADEMLAFMKAFHENDPDGNGHTDTYAQQHFDNSITPGMWRVPNGWRKNDDGTLTASVETDEWMQYVTYMKQVWDSGAIHPDAPSIEVTQMIDLFYTGKTGIMSAGYATWFGADPGRQDAILKSQPNAKLAPLMPIGHDGGEPVIYSDLSYFGFVAIPSSAAEGDDDKIDRLLRLCDWMYPPFGSEEYVFHHYGLEGVHHTMTENGPELTQQGKKDILGLIYGFQVQDLYIYHPGFNEQSLQQQQLLEQLIPRYTKNPCEGLFSKAENEHGPKLAEMVSNAVDDIVYGRTSMDELQKIPQKWRDQGGDKIRKEFEELLKNAPDA